MRYAVALLVNNLIYYETMLRNMPKQSDNIDFIIVNETRIGDIRKDIESINRKYKFDAEIYGSGSVTKTCMVDLELNHIGNKFIREYTMGMNILFQYYALQELQYDKVLFLDDDVLINKDLATIFESYDFGFLRSMLGYGIGKSQYDRRLKDLYNGDDETWKRKHINSGQRLYHKNILTKYRKMLELFMNEELFYSAWFMNKSGEKYYKGKSFFIDQNFENCLAHRTGILNDNLKPHVRIMNNLSVPKNLNLLVDREILHYACGQGAKIKFLKILQKGGVIK